MTDVLISLTMLLESTSRYVVNRIPADKDKFAYIKAMSKCYVICSDKANGNDIYAMRRALEHFRYDAPKALKRGFFKSENKYYLMAIEHAVDAVDSILLRFVRGYSSEAINPANSDTLEGEADGHQVGQCLECVEQTTS